MKVIDIVLPPPKTELEAHYRWVNRLHSQFAQSPMANAKRIEVTDQDAADYWLGVHGDSRADAEHARQEDEAMQL